MIKQSGKLWALCLAISVTGIIHGQAAMAAVQIQPFLCAGRDGSNASWVNVQSQNAIGVTLTQSGDQGGGNFVGLSNVKGNSVVTVSTIQNSTSANLTIRLTAKISTGRVITVAPSSSSGTTYTFNLASYGLNSSMTVTNIAVFAQNLTGSTGTIFLTQFVLNGTNQTNRINNASGCLAATGSLGGSLHGRHGVRHHSH